MPPFHVVIGADQLFVYTPAGGRPGSAFNPCAVNILNKLLQGFSGGLQLKTVNIGGLSLGGRNGKAIILRRYLKVPSSDWYAV